LRALQPRLQGRPLYIPGDGVGCFSYAAQCLNIPYWSTEPGGVGRIARDLGLIKSIERFTPLYYEQVDAVLIASQLSPYCHDLFSWPGSMVVYDSHMFFLHHPPRLKYVPDTGYKLYATEDLKFSLIPRYLREKFNISEIKIMRWCQELEKRECEAFETEEKHSLALLLHARLPVYSVGFAGAGCEPWVIKSPPPGLLTMKVGRAAGLYDLETCVDINYVPTGEGTRVHVMAKTGVIIYSSIDGMRDKGQPFKPVMTFRIDTAFHKVYGKTRTFHHYRIRLVEIDGVYRAVIWTKTPPPVNIVCLYGVKVISAIVRSTEYLDGMYYSIVEPGSQVADVSNRDIWRHRSELELAKQSGRLEIVNRVRTYHPVFVLM